MKYFIQSCCNSPDFLLKRKEKKSEEKVSSKHLRTNEAMTSGLHHFYISFIHSQNYLDKVHKQDSSHHLCLFSYLYILALHCYFVDLCLFLEDYTEILPTHSSLPLYTATWLCKSSCAHMQSCALLS